MGWGSAYKITVLLWAAATLGHADSARAQDFGELERTKNWCEARVDRLQSVRRESDALECANFYFFHQQLESDLTPFAKVLAYTQRAIEINPANYDAYNTVVWLKYSHWVMYHENPATFAHFKDGLEVAYQWADIAEQRFYHHALALKKLGDQLNPIWYHYDPSLKERVLRLYTRSESLSRDKDLIVRLRLNISHIHRLSGDREAAKRSYLWVLEADPGNKIAQKFLRELESGVQEYARSYAKR
ncbi:MAG TPA: hypothetical protein VM901_04675 [Bdellovibrionota bacterium]|jgi:tetratricopeptide (TPR) repeat protein|nr:hypothetical protein [Bdellovibrionota bacterium]